MENDPVEDVFPIENGDFPLLCLITGVYILQPYLYLAGAHFVGLVYLPTN